MYFRGEEGRKYRELLTSLKCGQCDKLSGVYHASIERISALVLMGPLLLEATNSEQRDGVVDSQSLLSYSLAEIERCMRSVTIYTSSCAIDAELVSTDHSNDPSLSKRACFLLRDFSFCLDLVQIASKRFMFEIKLLDTSEYAIDPEIRKEIDEGLCCSPPKTLFKWCKRSCGGRCGRSCRPALKQPFVKLGQKIVHHPSVATELRQRLRGRSKMALASLWTQVPEEPSAEPIELVPVHINYAKAITEVEFLGRGGFGAVFKCKWHNKDMVVKIIAGFQKLFEAEVENLTSFRHPNAVQAFGFGYRKEKTEGFILMERMEMDLSKLIQEVKKVGSPLLTVFPLDITLDILFQIVEGMCYLHERRVIHRDIKPENILVNRTYKGRKPLERIYHLKLADFGTSKLNEADSLFTSFRAGTSAYMAPEVMSEVLSAKDEETGKQGYSFKADVYSFGLVCSEILTGKRPFQHLPVVIIRNILKALEGGDKPAVLPLESDDPLRMLTEDCWKLNPGARPDFWEIRRRLWECRVYHFFKMEKPPTTLQTFRSDLESKLQAIRECQSKMGGLSDTIED